MSIGLKSDSNGTSGSIVINGSDAVLVTPTGITTASIQDSSITTAKIADANITFGKLSTSATEADNVAKRTAKVWVNFNGTGTVAIRASFNVSSITDNDTGDYVINFTTAIVDANYAALYTNNSTAYVTDLRDYTTISVRTLIDGSVADASINSVAVFR